MSMRNIYRKIAKEHGVTVAEVKRDMQATINHAYLKSDKTADETLVQSKVPRRGAVPTAEEFIRYASQKIKIENE